MTDVARRGRVRRGAGTTRPTAARIPRVSVDGSHIRPIFSVGPHRPRDGTPIPREPNGPWRDASSSRRKPSPVAHAHSPEECPSPCPNSVPTSAPSQPPAAPPLPDPPPARDRVRRVAGARGRARAERPRRHRSARDERHRAPLGRARPRARRRDDRGAQGRPRRRDPPAPDGARRPRLRDRHPRHRRRGLRLHAPPRPAAEPGRRLRQLQPGPPLRPARSATASPAPSAPRASGEKYWGLLRVDSVNGVDIETARRRPHFNDLTPVHPDELINLESDPKNLSQRLVNLVNPIGKGQRALIVSPPKAGKTMLLKAHRQRHHRELPGHPPHGRAHRRAARGSHGHAPVASRARSSARPSTSRPRTTPTSPRWRSRSPSARSRPAATS